jgi:hypothetical protein
LEDADLRRSLTQSIIQVYLKHMDGIAVSAADDAAARADLRALALDMIDFIGHAAEFRP